MRFLLSRMFRSNPFDGVEQLMARTHDVVKEMPALIDVLIEGDQDAVVERAKHISTLETIADRAKNELRSQMPVRMFLPVDRRDFLKLVSQIDAIADSAEDTAVLLTFRKMEVPESFAPLLRQLVAQCVRTVESAEELVHFLPTLLQSAFAGKAASHALALADHISMQERESDKIQDQLLKELFRHEDDVSPVAVSMWLRIVEALGDMANHAQKVGDQFRLFLAD